MSKEDEIVEMYQRIKRNSVPESPAGTVAASILVLAIILKERDLLQENKTTL